MRHKDNKLAFHRISVCYKLHRWLHWNVLPKFDICHLKEDTLSKSHLPCRIKFRHIIQKYSRRITVQINEKISRVSADLVSSLQEIFFRVFRFAQRKYIKYKFFDCIPCCKILSQCEQSRTWKRLLENHFRKTGKIEFNKEDVPMGSNSAGCCWVWETYFGGDHDNHCYDCCHI